MRRRSKIIVIATAIVVLLVIAWVTLFGRASVSGISLAISTNTPKTDHTFFTAFLTNNTGRPVLLYPLLVQLEEDYGMLLNNNGENWVDTSGRQIIIMPPTSFVSVSPQADPSIRRLRVIAEYEYDASAIPRFISRGLRKLNLSFLSTNPRTWLTSHGFVNGRVHLVAESDWMQNPMFEHSSRRRWESWSGSNTTSQTSNSTPR
jgi:hypothetical protein